MWLTWFGLSELCEYSHSEFETGVIVQHRVRIQPANQQLEHRIQTDLVAKTIFNFIQLCGFRYYMVICKLCPLVALFGGNKSHFLRNQSYSRLVKEQETDALPIYFINWITVIALAVLCTLIRDGVSCREPLCSVVCLLLAT